MRDKLSITIALTGFVVLVLAAAGMATYQCFASLKHMEDLLRSNATLIAGELVSATDQQEEDEIHTALRSPLDNENLLWTSFRSSDGETTYAYASGRHEPEIPGLELEEKMSLRDGMAILHFRVIKNGRYYGTLSLASNLNPLWHSMLTGLGATMLVVSVCMIVALRLSCRLLEFILVPVRQLAETAGRITRSNNFSLRAIKQTDDELGRLTESFNHMLEHIEKRESDLKVTQSELETKVEQLNKEQDQLRQAQDRERRLQQRLVIAQRLESQNLRHAKEQAESSSSAKSEFLASMSHEIRTPMNGIMGFASLLRETKLDEEQAELADIIHSSANNLLTLLNDLLDFSKIESGKIDLDYAPCDLDGLLVEVESIFRHEILRKSIKFSVHCSSRTPKTIVTDAGRLRQILFNLAGNAIKFTDEGSVEVHIDAMAVGKEQPLAEYSLSIEVRDTGIGIAESDLKRIFNSFTQVDASTTKRYGGAGLGLAITRRLTEMLGGEVGVKSDPGKGSTFFVNIPVRGAKIGAGGDLLESIPTAPNGTPLRVLVAEDSHVSQKLCEALLKKRGHFAQIVGTGEELLRQFEPRKFDVVVADVHMPNIDGFTAIAKIRKRESEVEDPEYLPVYVIVVTADAIGSNRESALRAGADEYLNKPMVKEEFLALIRKAQERVDRPAEHNKGPTENG
ncbi:MAG: ATP-binding protein [Verrucomicrobiota bacterium]